MNYNSEKDLKSLLSRIKNKVDPVIKDLLSLNLNQENQKLVKYQIDTGGKRLRPALAVICSHLLKGKEEDILYPAAGLEILHNYFLMVDDIIDNSKLRRNEKTCWVKFGHSVAECIAINYAATVIQSATHSKNSSAIADLFAETIKTVNQGQVLDILFERSGREDEPYVKKKRYRTISRKNYLEMISKKTASLIKTSCEVGGLSAEANEENLKRLRKFGYNLGMAYQIQDDILDMFGDQEEFGKEIGKDIKEQKGGNVIILLALEELSSNSELSNILREGSKKNVKRALNIIEKTSSRQKALELKSKFISRAEKHLSSLPSNKWREGLEKITDFVDQRQK